MSKEEFIFTNKFPQRLYRHLVFWLAYYTFSTLVVFHDGLEIIGFRPWILVAASEQVFHDIPQIIFCYSIVYYLIPTFWNQRKYAAFVIGLTVLSVGVFCFYFWEHMVIFKAIHFNAGLKFRPPEVVFWFTLISFLTFFPLTATLMIAIKTLKNFYIKSKENKQLAQENASAELQLLKAQIHPHFLFNTLNNIYSFALSKSVEAPGLVSKLSDTIRYMITDCNTELVDLQKEVKMLQDYIALESVRYGERLRLNIDIDLDDDNIMIAPLLMIPFVENCFKHGTSMMTGKQWIDLKISFTNGRLDFKVANSKPAQVACAPNKLHIGLANVKKRLTLLYPGKHSLNINTTDTSYAVHMKIQLEKESAPELLV
jgi:sensor histidine kinase YesM